MREWIELIWWTLWTHCVAKYGNVVDLETFVLPIIALHIGVTFVGMAYFKE
jgi:hypothetical protein